MNWCPFYNGRSPIWASAGRAFAKSADRSNAARLCWELEGVDGRLQINAIDADAHMIEREKRACYPGGALKELPQGWRARAFEERDQKWCLRPQFRRGIRWSVGDMREVEAVPGRYDLILCRNLAFIYFDEEGRREAARLFARSLGEGGVLVVGNHDLVPEEPALFEPLDEGGYLWQITPRIR